MSESVIVNSFVVSIGAVQYNCTLEKVKNVFQFTISRILGYKEKGGYKLADPVYAVKLYFRPFRKQMKIAATLIAMPDAKKYQPKIEEKTEVVTNTKTRKPLLT